MCLVLRFCSVWFLVVLMYKCIAIVCFAKELRLTSDRFAFIEVSILSGTRLLKVEKRTTFARCF